MSGKHPVLLIEDNPRLGKTFARLFQFLPVQITQAENVPFACECLAERPYDLILLDFQDHKLYQFFILSQKYSPPHSSEIIVLSGDVDQEDFKSTFPSHPLTFLPKPFDPQKLLDLVEKALDRVYVK